MRVTAPLTICAPRRDDPSGKSGNRVGRGVASRA
jgi:hypothetical protein